VGLFARQGAFAVNRNFSGKIYAGQRLGVSHRAKIMPYATPPDTPTQAE
jgi:hypothetical protein